MPGRATATATFAPAMTAKAARESNMTSFDWFYDEAVSDEARCISICSTASDGTASVARLDRDTSRLLVATLSALAGAPHVNWGRARQACLSAFHQTCASPGWLAKHPLPPESNLPVPPPARVVRKSWFGIRIREWTRPIGVVERINDERRWRAGRRWWRIAPVNQPIEPFTATNCTS